MTAIGALYHGHWCRMLTHSLRPRHTSTLRTWSLVYEMFQTELYLPNSHRKGIDQVHRFPSRHDAFASYFFTFLSLFLSLSLSHWLPSTSSSISLSNSFSTHSFLPLSLSLSLSLSFSLSLSRSHRVSSPVQAEFFFHYREISSCSPE